MLPLVTLCTRLCFREGATQEEARAGAARCVGTRLTSVSRAAGVSPQHSDPPSTSDHTNIIWGALSFSSGGSRSSQSPGFLHNIQLLSVLVCCRWTPGGSRTGPLQDGTTKSCDIRYLCLNFECSLCSPLNHFTYRNLY